jgi:hypothetical protein
MSNGGPLGPPWSAGETVVFWSSNQHDPSSRCCGRRPSTLAPRTHSCPPPRTSSSAAMTVGDQLPMAGVEAYGPMHPVSVPVAEHFAAGTVQPTPVRVLPDDRANAGSAAPRLRR